MAAEGVTWRCSYNRFAPQNFPMHTPTVTTLYETLIRIQEIVHQQIPFTN